MYASGLKITSQFPQENKRLSMHMSKHLHLSGILFSMKGKNIYMYR